MTWQTAKTERKLVSIADALDRDGTYEPKIVRSLSPGIVLTREWRGVAQSVTVTTDGFQHLGRVYGSIKGPILAIFAEPKACQPYCDLAGAKAFDAQFTSQVDAFEKGNPLARVVRLPYATHLVYQSNEGDVEREMNIFMDGLPKP